LLPAIAGPAGASRLLAPALPGRARPYHRPGEERRCPGCPGRPADRPAVHDHPGIPRRRTAGL